MALAFKRNDTRLKRNRLVLSRSDAFKLWRCYRGGKTHYAASLMSAADQQIPDDTRVVLEELITETGR